MVIVGYSCFDLPLLRQATWDSILGALADKSRLSLGSAVSHDHVLKLTDLYSRTHLMVSIEISSGWSLDLIT